LFGFLLYFISSAFFSLRQTNHSGFFSGSTAMTSDGPRSARPPPGMPRWGRRPTLFFRETNSAKKKPSLSVPANGTPRRHANLSPPPKPAARPPTKFFPSMKLPVQVLPTPRGPATLNISFFGRNQSATVVASRPRAPHQERPRHRARRSHNAAASILKSRARLTCRKRIFRACATGPHPPWGHATVIDDHHAMPTASPRGRVAGRHCRAGVHGDDG